MTTTRDLQPGTRVRFKFIGTIAEGEITSRIVEDDGSVFYRILFSLPERKQFISTTQPHYAVTEIED